MILRIWVNISNEPKMTDPASVNTPYYFSHEEHNLDESRALKSSIIKRDNFMSFKEIA